MRPPYFHPITRLATCAVLAASALVSCGPASKEKAAGTNDAVQAPATDTSRNQVRILTWADYFSPEVCEEFTRKTGISIEWRYYENLAEMNALLRSEPDAFDVVVLDDMSLSELIETHHLKDIHQPSIPNLKNIDARWMDKPFDKGNRFSVPYMWGTTLVAYRKDKIPNPDQSWNLLWDEKLKGRILMLNEKSDLYAVTLLSLGLQFKDENEQNLLRCTAKLLDQVEKTDARYTDIYEAKDKLVAGDCWAFLAYSGDAAVLVSENPDVGYFIPREGAPLWLDSFAIPKNTPNSGAAHAFIDFMSKPEMAAGNANFLSYATANRAATEFLKPELLSDPAIYPPEEILSRCAFIPIGSFNDTVTNRGMKEIFDPSTPGNWPPPPGPMPRHPPMNRW